MSSLDTRAVFDQHAHQAGLEPMQRTTFDVVIVGSGAAGGTLAAHLARRGARVAIVEGGPRVNTRTDFNTHAMPFDSLTATSRR